MGRETMDDAGQVYSAELGALCVHGPMKSGLGVCVVSVCLLRPLSTEQILAKGLDLIRIKAFRVRAKARKGYQS